jgi:phosphonate degradation associated HDIG domain protein
MKTPTIDKIISLFETAGKDRYGGEAVSQTQHALQAALAAEQQNGSPELICAALLHDVGHLLHQLPEDAAEQGIDDQHEDLGYRFLRKHFGPAVADPVRLHVQAKRYLCTVEAAYFSILSPASITSLNLQGGKMSPEEVTAFESEPLFREAVAVRRWDDIAKDPTLQTPDLTHYRGYLEQTLVA